MTEETRINLARLRERCKGRLRLTLTTAEILTLADAAEDLNELHDEYCGCDEPEDLRICNFATPVLGKLDFGGAAS